MATATSTGYCMKCKAQREIKNAKQITMKNGRPGHRGDLPRLQYEDLQNRRDEVNTPRNANTEAGCHRSVGHFPPTRTR